VTWRVAMAALAKLDGNRDRLRRSISEGMRLQTFAVGLPLAGFALVAPFVLPLVFGPRWSPSLSVFPFIALSYLSNAMFNLHSSVLYLLQKNWEVTWFHCVHILLFSASAVVLVPRVGFAGYGWAEVVALASYLVIHLFVAREVGSPSYGMAAIWYFTAAAIFALCEIGPPVSYLGFLVLLGPILLPRERASILGYAQILLSRANV
jgi:O-antigen/teichoic acid export membrane protein